jgi:hypothetical protein
LREKPANPGKALGKTGLFLIFGGDGEEVMLL